MRLKFSLSELGIKKKLSNNQLEKIFLKLFDLNKISTGIIYLQITRGIQNRDHAYKNNLKPTIIIYTAKKKFNLPNKNFHGVKVVTFKDLRWARRDIKSTNLLANILAQKHANTKNAYTAILVKDNKITEGVHSNIWIIKNNIIYTHPSNSNILKGVVRTVLKKIIGNLNIKLIEKSFTLKELYNADEVFLTSTGSFVTPIIKIDSKLINKAKIGNLSLKLATLYFKACSNE